MKLKDKQLLLTDLCARLPYRVKFDATLYGTITLCAEHIICFQKGTMHIKPYLRKMSDMTKEEKTFYEYHKEGHCSAKWAYALVDWLNANHFDYRGLIEKGLASEAIEGMYNS